MEKVLLVGAGDVGAHFLEFIARQPIPLEIIVGDVNEEKARLSCNNAEIGAAHHGYDPVFRPMGIDLFNIDSTAELIEKEKPSVVINGAVMHTWHLIRQLPEDVYARISSAALGAWLPCQLTLAMKLGEAMNQANFSGHFINTSLSCLTNPVLGKIGYPPTIGIGNVDLIAPAVRTYVAQQRGIARARVDVRLVAHHQHWVFPREAGYKPNAPYKIMILVDDVDVTEEFDTDKVMFESVRLYPNGLPFTSVSASSTIKNMLALMFDQNLLTHSPAPNGLPGGYPVRLSAKGAEVVLPEGWDLDECIKINEKTGELDGVKEIKEDGTVVFSDFTYEIMKKELGFDCKSFTPDESAERAKEQMSCFKALIDKYTQNLVT